ncbi:MAG: type I-E CRISPR-associated protein Cse2/CasB [Ardenticatenia bacterium]|jgi:CRISPR system Cascade subunit CasB|nr:MAG: type I-E CRISPR-associated protein Cse2/CasB [Ardenticatenia bacterium]
MHDHPYASQILTFIERLERLDAGERARLKRNAGKTLAEARDTALALFYRLLPPQVPEHHEETYFLVATLYPLAEAGSSGNLGDALRRARTMTRENPGLDRRVRVLLDADATQLPFRLRQAIHYLASARIPVNWAQLLQDLLAWDHPRRWVQREWARAYFAGPSPEE